MRVSPGGWCGFRRNFSGQGHKVCRGNEVCRVLFDGAGDRLLESGVRFHVEEKEADVCFKLLLLSKPTLVNKLALEC